MNSVARLGLLWVLVAASAASAQYDDDYDEYEGDGYDEAEDYDEGGYDEYESEDGDGDGDGESGAGDGEEREGDWKPPKGSLSRFHLSLQSPIIDRLRAVKETDARRIKDELDTGLLTNDLRVDIEAGAAFTDWRWVDFTATGVVSVIYDKDASRADFRSRVDATGYLVAGYTRWTEEGWLGTFLALHAEADIAAQYDGDFGAMQRFKTWLGLGFRYPIGKFNFGGLQLGYQVSNDRELASVFHGFVLSVDGGFQ